MGSTIEFDIEQALRVREYDKALNLYAEYFSSRDSNAVQVQHRKNAANLARKKLYDSLIPLAGGQKRLHASIEMLVGLKPLTYENESQKPNILYVPNLDAKPFWTLSEIDGLEQLCLEVREKIENFSSSIRHTTPYIGDKGSVPKTKDWEKLKQNWHQTAIIQNGQIKCESNTALFDIGNLLLASELVADCPPHAPEAFFSKLSPGAYIPPHCGISNVKLTVHIPLQVHSGSSITVSNTTRFWVDEPVALIFDDSFEHHAINDSDNERIVFIFDIWHPGLTLAERKSLNKITKAREQWFQAYGALASLDKFL